VEEDPWEVLGLPHWSDRSLIKAQYRRLTRIYHPDLGSSGSNYMMQRVIRAAHALLEAAERNVQQQERVKQHVSRVEKMWQQRARSEAEQKSSEVLIYVGRSPVRRAAWSEYRITTAYIRVWRTGAGGVSKVVRFQDVRHITNCAGLPDGRCDLEIEMVWGTRLLLEQLPQGVVEQVTRLVLAAQLKRAKQRVRWSSSYA